MLHTDQFRGNTLNRRKFNSILALVGHANHDSISNVRESVIPHLKHTLQAYSDCFKQLPTTIRTDLVLTLVEACRFPNLEWKRFAVAQANLAVLDVEDRYLRSRIAESESVLYRISGEISRSVDALGSPSVDEPSSTPDKRTHSASGQIAVQHALNYIQIENLVMAEKSLEHWHSRDKIISPMEEVVLFRKHMLLGRLLRYGGRFKESLAHLQMSQNLVDQHRYINFAEDLRDLTCDLADTLRELEDPVSGEHQLCAEIARRDLDGTILPGRSLLELSLSEALFAQGRFGEAEKLCLDIQSRPGLLKFEKLRLYITLAKVRHVNSDDDGAFGHWANALVAISRYPVETGGATRIIVRSICDILARQGRQELLDQYLQQLASLDELVRPGGVWNWIAGLRHWMKFLESKDKSFRSRM